MTLEVAKKEAAPVQKLISELPADKDILDNGTQISTAKKAYDALSDAAKAVVTTEEAKKLDSAVKDFITLAKGPANGAVTAVTNEADVAKKQAIVNKAKTNLDIAKDLGLDQAEYEHLNGFITEAQKLVDTAELEELVMQGKAIKLADETDLTTENIKFMTKRVQNSGGSQIVIDQDQLVKVFTEISNTDSDVHGITGNVIKYVSEGEVVDESAVVLAEGLAANLTVKNGYLLLNDTKMSKELFNAIKLGVGNEGILSYNITVLSGTNKTTDKIATIKFFAEEVTVIEERK